MERPAWLTAQLIVRLLGALAIVIALWWLYATITAKPKAEAKLAGNQVEAVQRNAEDAIGTVGAAGNRETAVDATTRSNEKEIRDAQGADAPVDPVVRDAGFASLCRRASYRRDPKCVQFTPAR